MKFEATSLTFDAKFSEATPMDTKFDAAINIGTTGGGKDGITPHIGENGNWFIGDEDTGVKAQGYTPQKGVDYFDGKDGKDGYTPQKGVDYFDGVDGKDGKDGYTPIKGVDYFDGKDGAVGEKGSDGYTPIKGIDYYTEADKAEMLSAVIAALPKYNGEVEDV